MIVKETGMREREELLDRGIGWKRGRSILGLSFLIIIVIFISLSQPEWVFAGDDDGNEVLTLPLSKAIELALEHAPEVLKGTQIINIRGAEEIIASQYPYNPEIEFEISSDTILSNEGEGSFKIGISQPIEITLKRALRKRIAAVETKEATFDLEDKKRFIRFYVKSLFGRLILLQEKLDFIDEVLDINRRLVKITEAKIEVGDIPEMNLGIAISQKDRVKNERFLIMSDISSVKKDLNLLIGRPVESDLFASGRLSIIEVNQLDPDELIETALKNRPDIKAIEIAKEKKEMTLLLNKKERIPDITLSLFYEEDNGIIEDLSGNDITDRSKVMGGSLSIELPFINRKRGGIIRAGEEKRLIEIELSNMKRRIQKRIIDLYSQLKFIGMAIKRLKGGILRQEKENIELIRSAYDLGEIEIGILLSAEERFIKTNMEYFDLLFRQYIAMSKLEEEIGRDMGGEDQ